jgi:hypothetical protein
MPFSFTSLSPWSVGQKIKAVTLNLMVTAIQELQTEAAANNLAVADLDALSLSTRYYLTQTKTAYVCSVSTDDVITTWTTSAPWTAAGSGFQVPADGIYAVTFKAVKTSGAWNTRAYLSVDANGTIVGRHSIDAGVAENNASVTVVTPSLTAGQTIVPRYYTGAAATCNFTVTIVRLPT